MRFRTLILVGLVTMVASGATSGAQSLSEMLEEGIFKEESVGDLNAAIKIYEQIVAKAVKNRSYAAQARYRLGMCYLKQGRKEEATLAFRILIDQFPEQMESVAQARIQLSKLAYSTSGLVTRQVWAPATDTMGEVSPDGRYFSYVNWTTGNLAVRELETGESRDVTNEGTWGTPQKFCGVSTWSPDSRQVAYYWTDRGSEATLRVTGLDGSKPRSIFGAGLRLRHAPWPRAWSKDGKYILALWGEENESLKDGLEAQIVLVSVADGSMRVLKSLGGQFSQYMQLSPDGRFVVFELEPTRDSGKRDIHLLATDGSYEAVLVDHPSDDGVPFWSPDGKRIVFLSDRSGSMGVWMLNVDDGKPSGAPTLVKELGRNSTPIGFTSDGSFYYDVAIPTFDVYVATLDFEAGKILDTPTKMSMDFEGSNYAPSWSSDGKYLAYASKRSAAEGYLLVIRSAETGEEEKISPEFLRMDAAHDQGAPRWSPDGRSIVVAGRTKGVRGFFLVDVQTGEFTSIVRDRPWKDKVGSAAREVIFSSDGKQVYYMRGGSIMAQALDSREERELYRANTNIYKLACSPDGRRLAFFEEAKLMTIPASGGKPSEVYSIEEGNTFSRGVGISWTPDGRHVVVGRPDAPDQTDELWRIPVAGGEPCKVDLGFNVNRVSLHPDGRRISFSAGGYGTELWVMKNFLPEPK